jgi:Flp pilus assembly protein TadD
MGLSKKTGLIQIAAIFFMAGCSTQPSVVQIPAAATPADREVTHADVAPPLPEQVAQKEYDHALASLRAGHIESAKHELLDLTRSYPNFSGPYANLGMLYLREGEMDTAEKTLIMAVTINPENAMAFNQLGILYRQTGKFNEARAAYSKALAIDPDYANAHLNLGILYDLFLQNSGQALQHYQRYLELIKEDDNKVSLWLVDLRQRIASTSVSTNGLQ